jgi:peptidyl-prolyl cis-trans isomerase C
MIKYLAPLLLLTLMLLLLCCKSNSGDTGYLAEVNGEVLDMQSFRAIIGDAAWGQLRPEQKRRYVEDWVNLTLLAQTADAQKLDQDPVVKERISYAKKKVKANALIAAELSEIKISEDQLFSYFRIHQADFQKAILTYKIQRIGLPDKLSAENVYQQINQGMDFGTALRRYSIDDLRAQNGVMGFVEPSSTDSIFWQAARALAPMQPAIVASDAKWYVFRYTESQESDKEASFEDHRDEIKQRIIEEKQEDVYQQLLRQIKSQNHEIYYY